MTDWPAFVLLAGAALVLHLVAATAIVAQYRVLPTRALDDFWMAQHLRRRGFARAVTVAISATLALVATWVMVLAIAIPDRAAGAIGAGIAAVELVLGAAWLAYLLRNARERRLP